MFTCTKIPDLDELRRLEIVGREELLAPRLFLASLSELERPTIFSLGNTAGLSATVPAARIPNKTGEATPPLQKTDVGRHPPNVETIARRIRTFTDSLGPLSHRGKRAAARTSVAAKTAQYAVVIIVG